MQVALPGNFPLFFCINGQSCLKKKEKSVLHLPDKIFFFHGITCLVCKLARLFNLIPILYLTCLKQMITLREKSKCDFSYCVVLIIFKFHKSFTISFNSESIAVLFVVGMYVTTEIQTHLKGVAEPQESWA